MARLCSGNINVVVLLAMAAAAMLLMTSGAAVDPFNCPPQGKLVYPYWSMCERPAKYNYGGEEVYELQSARGRWEGRLAPEWDESNSTYYVRLADVGAKYELTHITRDFRGAVAQAHDVIFINVESRRALHWREEGEEKFLVEVELGDSLRPALFQFSKADNVPLPCPLILNARCEAYYILHFGSSLGLSPYVEDDATYFKLSPRSEALPFLLLRSSNDLSNNIKMPAAT